MKKTLKDLRLNPKNPRRASDEKLVQLKKALTTFGDLGGFVYNVRTKRMVGGHQRSKVIPENTAVIITKRYEKPTKIGTVAEGYLEFNGERYKYREVNWDSVFEKAASIAANRNAGDWDLEELSSWVRELDEFGMDLELTMFDKDELGDFLTPTRSPNFEEGDEEDQGKLDEKKKVTCPECEHEFTP